MSQDEPTPPSPPNWGPPEGPVPPAPDPFPRHETDPLLPWQVHPAPPPPNPYASAEDEFPTGSPYAAPVDPAAIAAAHQAAGDLAAPARSGGAHRSRRSPWRYVLPALLGAVVVVAIGIGLAGWIGNTNDNNLGGTGGS